MRAAKRTVVLSMMLWHGISSQVFADDDRAPFALTGWEHFVLGSLNVTARAGRTNTASASDSDLQSNIPVEIEETDVKDVTLGYDKKPLLRDLYWLVMSPSRYDPSVKKRFDIIDDFLIDPFKLKANVAFGDTLKLKNGQVDTSKLTSDADSTTYSVFLSYEVPLENLWGHLRYRVSAGRFGYREKDSWVGAE